MKGKLDRIKPIRADMQAAVPVGAQLVGVVDGRAIYQQHIPRSKGVPDIDETTGEQRVRKHGITGEPMYKLRKHERWTDDRKYYLVDEGNGNVHKEYWKEPTAAEIAEAERKRRIEEMQSQLAASLVDAGMTPDDFAAMLSGKAPAKDVEPVAAEPVLESGETEPGETEPEKEPETVFPEMYAPGRWKLSDGTKMQAKKVEAEAAQAELDKAVAQAKENAAQAADY